VFPDLALEIRDVEDQLTPFIGPLRTFRNKVVFHAELDPEARQAARDAVFRPEVFGPATEVFFSLCVKLIRAEASVPGLRNTE